MEKTTNKRNSEVQEEVGHVDPFLELRTFRKSNHTMVPSNSY